MGHYASALRDPKVQQPRASEALFPREASGPEDTVQAKLVEIIEEGDEGVMLAATVTLCVILGSSKKKTQGVDKTKA